MILASAVLIAQIFGLHRVYETENSCMVARKLGGNLLGMLMIPVLSYMAYALAKTRPGTAAGYGDDDRRQL